MSKVVQTGSVCALDSLQSSALLGTRHTLRPVLSVVSFRVDLSHLTQHRLQHVDLLAIVGEPGAKRIEQFDGVFRDTATATDFDELGGQFATFMVCVVVELQVVEDVLGPVVALLQFGVRHRESRLGITELSENAFQLYRVATDAALRCLLRLLWLRWDARLRLTLYTWIHSNFQPTFPYI